MVGRPLGSADVAELIASGEDSYTEFKDPAVAPAGLAKELCAFCNAGGGRVLIGVDDDGRLVGHAGWDEERVMNVARTLVDPPVVPAFQKIVLPDGSEVAVVSVEPGTEKPYGVGAGEARRYFVRVGSTSREASREELIRLTQASGAVAGDLRPVAGAVYEDLDQDALAERFQNRRTIRWHELEPDERRRILLDAEILHHDSGGPTIGGLLCFGAAPQDRLPYASITCAAYPGVEPGRELLDRREARGRVDAQIRDASAFVERNLRAPSTVTGVERVELRPSPENIREVVANAVAHRHYGIAGPVQVRVFADRLEVLSPGGLPNGVTPEAMRVGIAVRRNQFIVQHLVERGLVDALGRGFVLIVEEAAGRGLPEPRVETPEGFVVVTLALPG